MKFKINKYKVNTNKIGNDKKIVLLSDIHYENDYSEEILDNIFNEIKKISPSYICIAGDILDQSTVTNLNKLIDFLKKISYFAPVIVELGNHDTTYMKAYRSWKEKKNQKFIEILNKINNIYLLDNKSIILDNIIFTGITLSYDYYYTYREKEKYLLDEVNLLYKDINPNDRYSILLCHSPIAVIKAVEDKRFPRKINLILSGHVHNGITPEWLTKFLNRFNIKRGFINPAINFFPNNVRGMITKNNIDIIVSEGVMKLSKSSKLNKLKLFPIEICEIDLIFKKES